MCVHWLTVCVVYMYTYMCVHAHNIGTSYILSVCMLLGRGRAVHVYAYTVVLEVYHITLMYICVVCVYICMYVCMYVCL